MKKMLFLIALLLGIMVFPTWSAPASKGKSGVYSVKNRNHTQTLGGKSGSASSKGLQTASGRSRAINGGGGGSTPVDTK